MNNNFIRIITDCIPLIIVVISYFLSIRMNTQNKKKEVVVKYLIEAWQILEKGAQRKHGKYQIEIESAIANIQLFGTAEQIKIAKKFAKEIARNNEASCNDLLDLLRKDLRKELNLEKEPENIILLRFE